MSPTAGLDVALHDTICDVSRGQMFRDCAAKLCRPSAVSRPRRYRWRSRRGRSGRKSVRKRPTVETDDVATRNSSIAGRVAPAGDLDGQWVNLPDSIGSDVRVPLLAGP